MKLIKKLKNMFICIKFKVKIIIFNYYLIFKNEFFYSLRDFIVNNQIINKAFISYF